MHNATTNSTAWDVEVFYDGACRFCSREIRTLRRLDKKGAIRFTDIAASGFDASVYGKDMDTFMSRIQARLPNGEWIDGVEVFRKLYGAIGYDPVVKPLIEVSRWKPVARALDWGYDQFAKNRLRWGGRCTDNTCT